MTVRKTPSRGWGIPVLLMALPIVLLSCAEIWKYYAVKNGWVTFYVQRSYAGGFFFVVFGGVLLAIGFVLIKWPHRILSAILLLPATLLALCSCVFMPAEMPHGQGAFTVRLDLEYDLGTALSLWQEHRGELPGSQSDLEMAVRRSRNGGWIWGSAEAGENGSWPSPFARDGRRIPYELVYVGNASGPYVAKPPVARPGVIYVACNDKRDRYWLTATVLAGDVGEKVVYLPRCDGAGVEVVGGRPAQDLAAIGNWVSAMAFSPDGHWLALARGKSIKLLPRSGEAARSFRGHAISPRSLEFSPDSRLLVSASQSSLKFWDVSTGHELRTISGESAKFKTATLRPDGEVLATGTGDGAVILWEVDTGTRLATLDGHQGSVIAVQFSPDGSLLAADSGRDIMIWDVATHCAVRVLRGHTRGVIDLSFSPDGRWLASCSDDETIGIWRVSDGQRVRTLAGHQDYLSAVEFSPDGRWLASGGGDAVIRIWDTQTWTEPAALRGHSKSILEMAFGPGSRLLASGGFDRSILLWELDDAGRWGRTQVHE